MGNEIKINYQRKLEEIINGFGEGARPSLLLHSCCGPCSSYVLSYLYNRFEITVLYYNPNIYPEEEYEHRLAEQSRLIDAMNCENAGDLRIRLMVLPYEHAEFLEAAKGLEAEPEGGLRCEKCFELRLKKTAELAAEGGFEYFGTTLTVSPHKNAMLINKIGQETDSPSVLWLPSDFKKKDGYKQSIELSKKYGLYRQDYCGCEYSKRE